MKQDRSIKICKKHHGTYTYSYFLNGLKNQSQYHLVEDWKMQECQMLIHTVLQQWLRTECFEKSYYTEIASDVERWRTNKIREKFTNYK